MRRVGEEVNPTLFMGTVLLNKLKHELITGFDISKEEKQDLIQFLKSLTDTTYLQHKNFLNPFTD